MSRLEMNMVQFSTTQPDPALLYSNPTQPITQPVTDITCGVHEPSPKHHCYQPLASVPIWLLDLQ